MVKWRQFYFVGSHWIGLFFTGLNTWPGWNLSEMLSCIRHNAQYYCLDKFIGFLFMIENRVFIGYHCKRCVRIFLSPWKRQKLQKFLQADNVVERKKTEIRMHSSRVGTARFSGRLGRREGVSAQGGAVCLVGVSAWGVSAQVSAWGRGVCHTPSWTDRRLWQYYFSPNFVCGR